MSRMRIIYKLMAVLLLFAMVIVLPYTYTIVREAERILELEDAALHPDAVEHSEAHREFAVKLLDQLIPYVFYIVLVALVLSIFFLRRILLSLKQLQQASIAMRDGKLDVRVEQVSEDEFGDVVRAFNEMAGTIEKKTVELKRKDDYVTAMLDPLLVLGEENTIVDVNPAFERLLGYERDEVIGMPIYELFDDQNSLIMREQLLEKREKGISSTYEISILTKDGVPVPVLISGAPIFSGDRIVGKIGILKDFREQAALRDELRRSRDYVETIMDSIQDEIIVVDREYNVIRANRTAALHAEVRVEGAKCHTLFHGSGLPCWAEGVECPTQIVFVTGESYRTTHQHRDLSGKQKIVEIIASPIKDTSGRVVHVIEMVRDVTERITHEEEIFRKNRELEALNSISAILSRSLRPEEIFSKVLERLIGMLNMDGGGIFFIDEARKDMTCQYHKGVSEEYVRMLGRIRLGDDIPGKVAVTGQSMTSSDVSTDTRIDRSLLKHTGIRGYCCVPIKGKERVLGVYCLFSFGVHVFNEEEERILNSVGEVTGMALENIKLYEGMKDLYERQRRRQEEEHEKLLSLSEALGAATDLQETMGHAVDLIKGVFSGGFVWLLLVKEPGEFVLEAGTDLAEREGEVIYSSNVASPEGLALSRKRPVVVRNLSADARFYIHPAIAERAFQTVVTAPLLIGERPVGALSVYFHVVRTLTDEEIHFLEILANILAVSHERSEYYLRAIREKGLADTVLQSVSDAILTVDTGGRVIAANRAVEKIVAISAEEAVGTPVCDIFRYDERNEEFRLVLGNCLDAALSGDVSSGSTELATAFGNGIAVMVTSAPVRDASGRITGVVNVLRDISREREIDRMKTELIRSVSHEFRTPLSAIVGMSEMILSGDVDPDKIDQYLTVVRNEGVRLSNMVAELLSIARIESGKESLRLSRIDMGVMMEHIRGTFGKIIESKGATLRYEAEGAFSLVADEDKMRRVLSNLVDNSLTFSNDACIIEVKARTLDGVAEIVVSDSGWGIPEEDLPHLTERFYRGRHGETVKGTGLGLALCSEIVKMHGGTMDIRSTPGRGTSVTLRLPAGREA